MTPRIALVTCEDRPEPDPDEELLPQALHALGASAEWIAWDGPQRSLAAYDLCALRTCWNYYADVAGFLAWCEQASRESRLCNPLEVVRWNHHKRYLEELRDAGIAVLPTRFVPRAAAGEVVEHALEQPHEHGLVVKPAVSASSFKTRRFARDALGEARAFVQELSSERDALVQPVMAGFESPGERSLMFIDGECTHAVTKQQRFAGDDEAVSTASVPTDDELAFAAQVLGRVSGDLLYARVDLIREGGALLLSELELIEPSLFLREHPPALERFAAAIVRRA